MSLKLLAAGLIYLVLYACTSAPSPHTLQPTPQPTGPALVEDSPPDGSTPPDVIAAQRMAGLSGQDREAGAAALAQVLQEGDRRFIPVLLEILRANEIGLHPAIDQVSTVAALETLSGESFGSNWAAWVEWYGTTDLTPPPGFTGWKGRLLARIDPQFAEFLMDGAPARLRVEEIVWGGVRVDGIPALDQPEMVAADEAAYLIPEEPVFGVSLNGDSRAYPLRIMDWHEMANDIVGGVPVSLAYCTLCGAGIAFNGRAANGATYDFGSSGFLYRSNKLMYDRQTRTLWNQLTGEPVLGELAADQLQLSLLPVVLTSWEAWRTQHPDTSVLSLETGFERYYLPGAAYGHYFATDEVMFPVWRRGGPLGAKDRIYALRVAGVPKAYPLDLLVMEGVVNDTVGDTGVVLVASRGRILVEGVSLLAGEVRYDAGGEVRAFLRGEQTFIAGPTPELLLDSSGREWQITEHGLRSPEGDLARRLGGHLAYWFGWYAFFPNTLVYESPDSR